MNELNTLNKKKNRSRRTRRRRRKIMAATTMVFVRKHALVLWFLSRQTQAGGFVEMAARDDAGSGTTGACRGRERRQRSRWRHERVGTQRAAQPEPVKTRPCAKPQGGNLGDKPASPSGALHRWKFTDFPVPQVVGESVEMAPATRTHMTRLSTFPGRGSSSRRSSL